MRILTVGLSGLVALSLFAAPAAAQPGILKKAAKKVTGTVSQPLQPPKYTNELLELTEPRLQQLIAGKVAAKKANEAPDGPKAVRKQLDEVTARRDAIYEKNVDQLNKWDDKRMEYERCVGDKLAERSDQVNQEFSNKMMSDRAFQMRLSELGMALQQAQQQGDKAKADKITAELDAMRKPTKADSLAAEKACGSTMANVPSIVGEYNSLVKQAEGLTDQLYKADRNVERVEDETSKLDKRQRAIACERIKAWEAAQAQGKQALEFSETEIAALSTLEKEIKGKCD